MNRLFRYVGNLPAKIRHVGLVRTATEAFGTVVPKWFLSFQACQLYRLDLPLGADVGAVEVCRWWVRDEPEAEARGMPSATFDDARNPHARVALLCRAEQVVGIVRVASPDFQDRELGVHFLVGKTGVWLFGAVVQTELRGQGLYSQLLTWTARQFTDRGFATIHFAIDRLNRSSRAAHEKLGAQVVGALWIARLFGGVVALSSLHGEWKLRFGWRIARPVLEFNR